MQQLHKTVPDRQTSKLPAPSSMGRLQENISTIHPSIRKHKITHKVFKVNNVGRVGALFVCLCISVHMTNTWIDVMFVQQADRPSFLRSKIVLRWTSRANFSICFYPCYAYRRYHSIPLSSGFDLDRGSQGQREAKFVGTIFSHFFFFFFFFFFLLTRMKFDLALEQFTSAVIIVNEI